MRFGQKLEKLTEGLAESRAELSRRAGLPPNAISDYINKGHLPRLDTAFALAKLLGVSVDWLADDDADFPPPTRAFEQAETPTLLREVGRRLHSGVGRYLLPKLKAAEETSWANVGRELAAIDPAKPLPPMLKQSLILPLQIRTLMSDVGRYDPLAIVPADDPAEVREATEANAEGYTLLDLIRREEDLQHGQAYYEVFKLVFSIWTRSLMDRREQLAVSLDEAREMLRKSLTTFEGLAVLEARQREGMQVAIIDTGVDMAAVEADIAEDEERFRRARSAERATRSPRI